jgi:predicted nucleic acid-binding protein
VRPHSPHQPRWAHAVRRYRIAEADVRWARDLLDEVADLVMVTPEAVLPVTGDPEDDAVLATARLARAGYLVTGDRGLLALGRYEGTEIFTPRRFLDILDAAS